MAVYYALSSYNSKKRIWEHETTTENLTRAKDRAKSAAKSDQTKWRIVKEQVLYVYDEEGKVVNK